MYRAPGFVEFPATGMRASFALAYTFAASAVPSRPPGRVSFKNEARGMLKGRRRAGADDLVRHRPHASETVRTAAFEIIGVTQSRNSTLGRR